MAMEDWRSARTPAIKTSKSRSEAVLANAKAFDEGKKDATPDEDVNDVEEDIFVENDYDDVLIDIKITILQQFTSLNTFLLSF